MSADYTKTMGAHVQQLLDDEVGLR